MFPVLAKPLNRIKMDFFKDLFHFLAERKKWWLIPMVIMLLLFSLLAFFATNTTIAPYIYTLF